MDSQARGRPSMGSEWSASALSMEESGDHNILGLRGDSSLFSPEQSPLPSNRETPNSDGGQDDRVLEERHSGLTPGIRQLNASTSNLPTHPVSSEATPSVPCAEESSGLTPAFQGLGNITAGTTWAQEEGPKVPPARTRRLDMTAEEDQEEEADLSPLAPPIHSGSSGNDALDLLRNLIRNSLQEDDGEAACYFADKLVHFSDHERHDVLLLAKCQARIGSPARALHTLEKAGLLSPSPETSLLADSQPLVMVAPHDPLRLRAMHLAALCHSRMDKLEKAMEVLERCLGSSHDAVLKCHRRRKRPSALETTERVDLVANLCCLRGKLRAKQGDRHQAVEWLQTALQIDSHCIQALQTLTKQHLLGAKERNELVGTMNFRKEEGWLEPLYRSLLHNDDATLGNESNKSLTQAGLHKSTEVLLAQAERAFARHDPEAAHHLCEEILKVDPHCEECMPLHAASLGALNRKPELFYLAHRLIQANPSAPHAWFAVGCYYLTLQKHEQAQRYFLKSTKLDAQFCPGWVGFGCSFSAREERDQAISAYLTATRLFPGQHLPLLYIGMEYVQMNSLSSGFHFLERAEGLCGTDPLIYNELGTAHFKAGDYSKAIESFMKVVWMVTGEDSQKEVPVAWETAVFNLGHCHRKLRQFDAAERYFHRALALCPHNGDTHSALAFTYHLQGKFHEATSEYHKALALKPDDAFASDMLVKAIRDSLDNDVGPVGFIPTSSHKKMGDALNDQSFEEPSFVSSNQSWRDLPTELSSDTAMSLA